MANPRSGPPHAGHQLHQLATETGKAHAAIGTAEAAAVAAAAAELLAGRETKQKRRQDRLALIEERNKHAAGHPVQHAG